MHSAGYLTPTVHISRLGYNSNIYVRLRERGRLVLIITPITA